MKKKKIEQITEKLIDEDIFDTDGTLTQEELDFLKTNPALLAKLTDTNYIKKKYILILFLSVYSWLLRPKLLNIQQFWQTTIYWTICLLKYNFPFRWKCLAPVLLPIF
ncbi:hypothetical protein [Niabella drilacis]|uniref:Uncharacterized protein n=1 Tax=Niabella drilacis (strain DSM 25811 / CCM 8410 / CCUG 62505 / LMG 26954 / E90) TaxID=1285928 RepID=A0A1G6UVL2_NIADE|nr:hypothetical protein [Niabella drilacis]SDD44595.1 hypothetical protein SAMN04487894_10984 [Niabella drilacis]